MDAGLQPAPLEESDILSGTLAVMTSSHQLLLLIKKMFTLFVSHPNSARMRRGLTRRAENLLIRRWLVRHLLLVHSRDIFLPTTLRLTKNKFLNPEENNENKVGLQHIHEVGKKL